MTTDSNSRPVASSFRFSPVYGWLSTVRFDVESSLRDLLNSDAQFECVSAAVCLSILVCGSSIGLCGNHNSNWARREMCWLELSAVRCPCPCGWLHFTSFGCLKSMCDGHTLKITLCMHLCVHSYSLWREYREEAQQSVIQCLVFLHCLCYLLVISFFKSIINSTQFYLYSSK